MWEWLSLWVLGAHYLWRQWQGPPFLVAMSPFTPSLAGCHLPLLPVQGEQGYLSQPSGQEGAGAGNTGMCSVWPGAPRGATFISSSFFPAPQAKRDVVIEIGHIGKMLLPPCPHWLWDSFRPSCLDAGSSPGLTRVSEMMLCRPLARG